MKYSEFRPSVELVPTAVDTKGAPGCHERTQGRDYRDSNRRLNGLTTRLHLITAAVVSISQLARGGTRR